METNKKLVYYIYNTSTVQNSICMRIFPLKISPAMHVCPVSDNICGQAEIFTDQCVVAGHYFEIC